MVVAIEVSALGGAHAASEFVEFAAAALAGVTDVELRTWSVRRLRGSYSGSLAPTRLCARVARRARREARRADLDELGIATG